LSKNKRICVLTGTRSEYGLLKPVIEAIARREGLDFVILATGMHLSEKYGRTVDEIIEDGYGEQIETFHMLPSDNSSVEMARSIGDGVRNATESLSQIQPDILLVLGDRAEVLAGVIAAAYMNIPIAHIHGGDVSQGGLDESARHAITKFAHIHFAATPMSAKRIKLMGENPENVYTVGAPGLDSILKETLLSKEEVYKKFGLQENIKTVLLIQHPVTTQVDQTASQIEETLSALSGQDWQVIAIYPNNDAGSEVIINALDKFAENTEVKVFKNLKHLDYLSLLACVDVLIGNSSSGIIESSSFKLPVINIGIRQKNRERSTNVIDVEHDRSSIRDAIRLALSNNFIDTLDSCINPYGEGKAGELIASILADIEPDHKLLQKKLMYE
jgi:UDP-N-acetylglucosamine 2-epimerase (non-hydrolysing)/GDP/UDP-N,N'-diacetylbacillosamine 2-epimerase (hydrolysing)